MRVALVLALVASVALAEEENRTDSNGDPLPVGAVARLGSDRFALPFRAWDLCWIPDGRGLAIATGQEVRVYDPTTGRETLRLIGHTRSVSKISVSPDGRSLDSVSLDDTLRTWDLKSGQESRCIPLPEEAWVEAVSSAGGRFLRAAWDEPPRLIDMGPGAEDTPLAGVRVSRAAFSGDGRWVGGVGPEGEAWWADAKTGIVLGRAGDVWGVGIALRFLPRRGEVVVASGRPAIAAYRHSNGEFAWWAASPFKAQTIACSPDEATIAVSDEDRSIVLLETGTGRQTALLGPLPGPVSRVEFSPDGKRLAVAFGDCGFAVLDLATGRLPEAPVSHRGPVWSISVSSDGAAIASGGGDGTVRLWDAETSKERQRLEVGYDVRSVSLSPKGDLAVCSVEGGLTVHGLLDGVVRPMGLDWTAATYAPDGSTLACAGFSCRVGVIRDRGRSETIRSSTLPSAFHRAVAISSDGGRIAYMKDCMPLAIEVLDSAELDRVGVLQGTETVAWSLAFSPDGRCLAYGGDEGAVRVWEVGEGQGTYRFDPLSNPVSSVAWSRDGRWIAAGDDGGRVVIYDLLGGRAWPFDASAGRVCCVAFSPDGKQLCTGHSNGTILAWGVPAPEPRVKTDLAARWEGLASSDAAEAIWSVWDLAAQGDEAVEFLDTMLTREDPAIAAARALVPALDADEFEEREKASKGILDLGPSALPVLHEALRAGPSPELEGRLRGLIEAIGESGIPLRRARAMRALRLIATPAAEDLLRRLGEEPR